MTLIRTRHRFTVDEYEEMIRHGILGEEDRVELIRGEIIDKMTIGDKHAASVKRLNRLFADLLGRRITLGIQDPIRLDDSRPEPDVALLQPREDFYASGAPRAEDVLLVIEVSDTTLDYDRQVKGELYAETGIAEYWIVNLLDDTLEVYRQPTASGYSHSQTLTRGQQITPVSFPDLTLAISDMV